MESYGEVSSESYSLWFPEEKQYEDAPLYRSYIKKSGKTALEIGCGNGRLLVPFLQEGFDVDGIDTSPYMVDICRNRAERSNVKANIYLQAMEQLDIPRRYGTIYVPYGSFMFIDNIKEAKETLKRFYEHLNPFGYLLVSLFIPTETDIDISAPTQDSWRIRREGIRPDGSLVRCWEKATFDLKNQEEHSEYRYEVIREGRVIKEEFEKLHLHWYTQQQFQEILASVGFRDIKCLRDNDGEIASPKDCEFTFVGQK